MGKHEPSLDQGIGKQLSLWVLAKCRSITTADASLIDKTRFVAIVGVKTTEMFADLSAQLGSKRPKQFQC